MRVSGVLSRSGGDDVFLKGRCQKWEWTQGSEKWGGILRTEGPDEGISSLVHRAGSKDGVGGLPKKKARSGRSEAWPSSVPGQRLGRDESSSIFGGAVNKTEIFPKVSGRGEGVCAGVGRAWFGLHWTWVTASSAPGLGQAGQDLGLSDRTSRQNPFCARQEPDFRDHVLLRLAVTAQPITLH